MSCGPVTITTRDGTVTVRPPYTTKEMLTLLSHRDGPFGGPIDFSKAGKRGAARREAQRKQEESKVPIKCGSCGRNRDDDALSDGDKIVPCSNCAGVDLTVVLEEARSATRRRKETSHEPPPSVENSAPTWDTTGLVVTTRELCPRCVQPHAIFNVAS